MSGILQNKQSPGERPREAGAAVETDAECQLLGGLCISHCQACEELELCKLFTAILQSLEPAHHLKK